MPVPGGEDLGKEALALEFLLISLERKKERKLKNQKALGQQLSFCCPFLAWEPTGCIHLTHPIKKTQGPNSAVEIGCRQLARLQERAHHYLFSLEKSRGQQHIHMCRRHLKEHKLLNGMKKPTNPENLPCWVQVKGICSSDSLAYFRSAKKKQKHMNNPKFSLHIPKRWSDSLTFYGMSAVVLL